MCLRDTGRSSFETTFRWMPLEFTDNNGQPFALITSRQGWSVTASHEVLETSVNPKCLFLSAHPRLQPPHAAQPAIVIVRLAAEIFGHLRMRQNEKPLLIQPLHHSLGDILRRDRSFEQEVPGG